MLDSETGEYVERKLEHAAGEAQQFYEALQGRRVIIGMEACGNSGWVERMVQAMGHELWLGDAGTIRSLVVRKQKTDRRDARAILRLLRAGRVAPNSGPNPGTRGSHALPLRR